DGHREVRLEDDVLLALEPLDEAVTDRNADEAAEQRQNEALRQEQAHDPRPTRADRQPDRDFSRPAPRAREEQPRYVGACPDQDRQREDHEEHAELPIVVLDGPGLELGVDRGPAATRDARVLGLKLLRQDGELVAGILERRAGLPAPPDRQLAIVAVLEET